VIALSGDRVAGLVLVAIAAVVAIETRVLPLGRLGQPGPGYAPLLYAAILTMLGIAVAARRGGTAVIAWRELPHAALIAGSVAFAALALERLGYRLTMLAVLVFLLGAVERKHPLAVALLAVGLSFGSHYVFWTLLRVPLPTGPFGL
jgi:putative tricarboxylic transport membrane protein